MLASGFFSFEIKPRLHWLLGTLPVLRLWLEVKSVAVKLLADPVKMGVWLPGESFLTNQEGN